MDKTFRTLRLETVDTGIRRITLDRPDRLNAMTDESIGEFHDALDTVATDDTCRALIVTGAGRGFCAGLDLVDSDPVGLRSGEEGMGRVQRGLRFQQHIATLIPHLRSLRIPVIAAVNGVATGGGLALALGADIRVAAEAARFGVAFVRVGLSGCDIGVSWNLPRLIGASRAFDLMLTGRIIDSGEALEIGLVSTVVPDGRLAEAALEKARQIRANSPFGV